LHTKPFLVSKIDYSGGTVRFRIVVLITVRRAGSANKLGYALLMAHRLSHHITNHRLNLQSVLCVAYVLLQ